MIAALHTLQTLEPELTFDPAKIRHAEGQFSHVLLIDEINRVFRLPKSAHVAAEMAQEGDLLKRLQGQITLPIPNPTVDHRERQTGAQIMMGYAMLPGIPLTRANVAAITDDSVLDRIAEQIAGFLQQIHTLPTDSLGLSPPDLHAEWAEMYAQFREKLYPYMRPDAQAQVSADFEAYLGNEANFAGEPVLIHGDLGGSNIIFDPQAGALSGVIDFGGAGLGDPAQDLGALRVSFGDAFIERVFTHYPALRAALPRATFMQSTYALQQALYALRDGNQEDFDDGISAYR